MSTVERREFHTTRTTRTLSPTTRTLSSQNLTEFDHNLDHLLEDLQSSVSRPGSSLGNANTFKQETRTVTYGGGKSDSLSRVQHLNAANPTTVVADDSYTTTTVKPGETVKTVKIYKENYSSRNANNNLSPEKSRMQNNINKLDTLLDDLQQARQGNIERDFVDAGIDPGLLELTGKNRDVIGKKTVQRELVYDLDSPRSRRGNSVEREIIVNVKPEDGTYGDIKPIRHRTPSPTSRSATLQKKYTREVTDTTTLVPVPRTEVIESTKPDINPTILAQLDPNLLPPPNTKVTTTIKTYTYEIPGAGYPSTVSPKLSETVFSSNPSTPSQSFAYNKIENSSANLSTNYPGNYVRPISPNPSGHTTKYVENVTTTTRNVNDGYPPIGFNTTPTPGKKTYVYNETTSRNINDYPYGSSPRSPRSPLPSEKRVHIYNETTTSNDYLSNRPKSPTSHHTYIINESNTRNTSSPYPRNGYPPNQSPNRKDPVNITYKYTSHTTSSNNYRGHPNDESEPLLQPGPFPTGQIEGPPKQLDKLMAEIGREPPNNSFNAGYNAKEAERAHKREVEKITEHSTTTQKKVDIKDLPKTKNIAGPPVYYPPGHEMFSHKEESGGYKADGGMMKESGKYKYEAKSSSKSKSSSGVAMVPVCLPLCCGLPCVIM